MKTLFSATRGEIVAAENIAANRTGASAGMTREQGEISGRSSSGRMVRGGTYEIADVQFRALQILGSLWIYVPDVGQPRPFNILGWVRVRNRLCGRFAPNNRSQTHPTEPDKSL